MASEKLSQAVQLIKTGNKQGALPILKQIVLSDPNNEMAWLWLYSCVEDNSQKKYCLEKALEINPSNQNARIAFKKITGQQYSKKSNVINPSTLQQGIDKSSSGSVQKQKSKVKVNRNLFLISGAVILFFLVIGGVALISWQFMSSFDNNNAQYADEQTESPALVNQDSNNSLENATSLPNAPEIETAFIPTSDSSTPSPSSTPDTTLLDFRIVALSMERIDGVYNAGNSTLGVAPSYDTSTGYDTLIFNLAGENYSDVFLGFKFSNAKLITSEGYEYPCRKENESIFTLLPDDNLFLPKMRRKLPIVCEMPELTTGHRLILIYAFDMISMVGSEFRLFDTLHESYIFITKEIQFEPKDNTNASIPLMEEYKDNYLPGNAVLRKVGEPINYGDATITFNYSDGKSTINIKNNFIGGNTKVNMEGLMFFSGDNYLYTCSGTPNQGDFIRFTCGISFELIPNQQLDAQEWLIAADYGVHIEDPNKLLVKLKSSSCVLFTRIEVINSANTFRNENPEMICFK